MLFFWMEINPGECIVCELVCMNTHFWAAHKWQQRDPLEPCGLAKIKEFLSYSAHAWVDMESVI